MPFSWSPPPSDYPRRDRARRSCPPAPAASLPIGALSIPAPPPPCLLGMSPEQQQLILALISDFVASMPLSRYNRCDGFTAIQLSCVARNPQRHRLSAWGWRQLCLCEQVFVRRLNVELGQFQELLDRLGTLLRSNTSALAGSLTSRIRQVVSASAILDGLERNSREVRTPAAVREWFASQMQWGRFFFGVDNLSDDQPEAVVGEYIWTDSEVEGSDEDVV